VACRLCDGTCAGSNLDGLVTAELAWLWTQLGDAADRRGDPSLTTGTTTVTAPADIAGRTAAAGLLDRRHLKRGQRVRVNLALLAEHTAPATPGALAAHAIGCRLAVRAAARTARVRSEADLRDRLSILFSDAARDDAWSALRRAGWVTKILTSDDPAELDRAAAIIALLPGPGQPAIDRRLLAHAATGDPHDLDRSRPVAGLTLALLAATGRIRSDDTPRAAWASVGVGYDDITGGLTVVSIVPDRWTVPDGAPVTLTPRVLDDCTWPAGHGQPVYVTENPSVLSAAAGIPGARVVCTTGTPSRIEVAAIARLADVGWQLRVRADFDDAGINHANTILSATPGAQPWRMRAVDYLEGLQAGESTVLLRTDRLGSTPWDPDLHTTMVANGVAVYEEALLDKLVRDIEERR
jgi:uncharacterized protein (TIGR02679 family)